MSEPMSAPEISALRGRATEMIEILATTDADPLGRVRVRKEHLESLVAGVYRLAEQLRIVTAMWDAEHTNRAGEQQDFVRLMATLVTDAGGELRGKDSTYEALDADVVLSRHDDHATHEIVFRVDQAPSQPVNLHAVPDRP